jgi:type II secretion system protein H
MRRMTFFRGSRPICSRFPDFAMHRGFTLLELLVVMAIIAIVAAFVIPALSPGSARALDGATRQFAADLENARLIAIAERTRTRVLLPTNSGDFSTPAPSPTPWPADISRRGYLITSQKKTETVWRQRGKWNRFPQGVAVQTFTQPSPAPTPTAIPIDVGGTGSQTYAFSGPYIEFLANGTCNLDPAASPALAVILADGFVSPADTFEAKNRGLTFTVTVDPLSGSVLIK